MIISRLCSPEAFPHLFSGISTPCGQCVTWCAEALCLWLDGCQSEPRLCQNGHMSVDPWSRSLTPIAWGGGYMLANPHPCAHQSVCLMESRMRRELIPWGVRCYWAFLAWWPQMGKQAGKPHTIIPSASLVESRQLSHQGRWDGNLHLANAVSYWEGLCSPPFEGINVGKYPTYTHTLSAVAFTCKTM